MQKMDRKPAGEREKKKKKQFNTYVGILHSVEACNQSLIGRLTETITHQPNLCQLCVTDYRKQLFMQKRP